MLNIWYVYILMITIVRNFNNILWINARMGNIYLCSKGGVFIHTYSNSCTQLQLCTISYYLYEHIDPYFGRRVTYTVTLSIYTTSRLCTMTYYLYNYENSISIIDQDYTYAIMEEKLSIIKFGSHRKILFMLNIQFLKVDFEEC